MDLVIKELKKKKAAGFNELTNELITESYRTIKEYLIRFIIACLQYGHTPKMATEQK